MTTWNFAYGNNNPTDDYGHGTNVAGIIGANGNNSIGYAGVDWHCKLMIIKGLDSANHGYYSWWADGITYATDNGAKVINLSLEGTSSSVTLQDAITYAYSNKVTVVACMGNYNSVAPSYPAACSNVIAVGATNAHDCRVNPFFWGGGSDFGPNISVVAPGNYIYGLDYKSNTNYSTYWGGTSQATPHVSGLASLLLAQDTSRTPDQIKHIIEVTADDMVGNPAEDVPGWDQYYGFGRINAYHALQNPTLNVSTTAKQNNNVEIYPNPATGMVSIRVNAGNDPINYSVTNVLGRVVLNGMFSCSTHQIDFSAQPRGMYTIRLNSNNFCFIQKEIVR